VCECVYLSGSHDQSDTYIDLKRNLDRLMIESNVHKSENISRKVILGVASITSKQRMNCYFY